MLHSEFMLDQRPHITNAQAAKAWIGELPLTDARAAHHAIEALLTEFDEINVSARDRLEILETVRSQRIEIDHQYAQRYAGKALPLGEAERKAFRHACSLWRKMEDAYWFCARAAVGEEPELRPRLALCLARAADLACERIQGTLRAGQTLDGTIQASIARYANFAIEHNVLTSAVPDSEHPRRVVSVASVQNRALLLALAGGTVGGRERESAFELAAIWENKPVVTWLPAGLTRALTRGDLPPSSDPAKQRIRIIHSGGNIYFIDVTAISRSLRKRVHLLGLGQSLDTMALPASFPRTGAAKLLTRLHGAWCEEEYGRRHPRTAPPALPQAEPGTHANVAVAPGGDNFDAMFCLTTGNPFSENDENEITSRKRFDEMFVFQGAGHARREKQLRDAQKFIEQWRIVDHSAAGARLVRSKGSARFKPGHLIAFCSTARGADNVAQLAEVRWCAEGSGESTARNVEGPLEAGVEVLAQAPVGLAIRLTGVNVIGARTWVSAFRTESGVGGHLLITPAGWYKPGRVIEAREGKQVTRWLLGPLKRRGIDFEVIEASPTT